MSQARLPRTEPSTELITAHKANHRAAHVAGRAVGIFAKVSPYWVIKQRSDHNARTATRLRVEASAMDASC